MRAWLRKALIELGKRALVAIAARVQPKQSSVSNSTEHPDRIGE